MYKNLFFEVSGICNSHCPWCVTGNRSGLQAGGRFIEPDLFRRALDRIRELSLATPDALISLYNWGEIFLHPHIDELLGILVDRKFRFAISTNGSKLKPLPQESLSWLDHLIFSFPGFSQKSYDRVHGFNFVAITESVASFIQDSRSRGYSHGFKMAYHIYQFNIDEIAPAYAFCRQQGIEFAPVIANLGDFDIGIRYREGTLDGQTLKKAGEDLLLYYAEELIESRPKDFVCPQHSVLAIDEYANVLTCCAVPRKYEDYTLGSLFDLNAEQIDAGKKNRKICGKCGSLGLDFWGSNPVVPLYVNHLKSLVEQAEKSREEQVLREHYNKIISERLKDYFGKLCTLLETGHRQEAFAYYEQYRWCFPEIPIMGKIDAMMAGKK